METFTDQDLIAELQKFDPPIEMRDGGVTQQEWAEAQGIDPSTACEQLRIFVKDGKLHRIKQRCVDGLVRYVYYKS